MTDQVDMFALPVDELERIAAMPKVEPRPKLETSAPIVVEHLTLDDHRRKLKEFHELMFGPGGIEPPAAPIGELGDAFDLAHARGSIRPIFPEEYRKLHIGRTFGMSFFNYVLKVCPRCGATPYSAASLRGSQSWAHACEIAEAACP